MTDNARRDPAPLTQRGSDPAGAPEPPSATGDATPIGAESAGHTVRAVGGGDAGGVARTGATGAAGAAAEGVGGAAATGDASRVADAGQPTAGRDAADGDEVPPGYRRSGLRNPAAAVRGMGAAALGLQGVVLLLAIQPIRVLGDGAGTAAIWALVALIVVCFALCGMMRRRWAWTAGTVVQAALLVGGLLHWTLFALGVIFGLVWLYVLYVRRSILG